MKNNNMGYLTKRPYKLNTFLNFENSLEIVPYSNKELVINGVTNDPL